MITSSDDGVYLDIQVQARARRPGIRGVQGERLRIAVSEPAEGGKANRAVIAMIADLFRIRPSTVVIVKGATSTMKRVFIRGVDPGEVRRRLS